MLFAIILPVLVLGCLGLFFGVGLTVASKKFAVETDPRLPQVRDALPGANCGGCGFAGCDAFAAAVLDGSVKPDACPVGGNKTLHKIADILGIDVTEKKRECAFIRCGGCDTKSNFRYDYVGMRSCGAAMQLAGNGSKSCKYGCLGGGSCEQACHFGAISMKEGIAVVDNEKCTGCRKCIDACPKKLIVMVPHDAGVRVNCNSHDVGKAVRVNCSVGCISCKLCEKACGFDAIHVSDNLATIDYDKCTECGACVEKCPSKCIIRV